MVLESKSGYSFFMFSNPAFLVAIVFILLIIGIGMPFILDATGSFFGSTVVAGIGLLALVGALLIVATLCFQAFQWLRTRGITENE
tara:strand:+ start:544 stop:801 length:258 start_codon:yes stop_codon:yes gene_type:complete